MKIGIITINDNDNYGNRLQNYATQEILKKIDNNNEVITIKNDNNMNYKSSNRVKYNIKKIKYYLKNILTSIKKDGRKRAFLEFDKKITFSKEIFSPYNNSILDKKYDCFFVGSDQVWNPNGRMTDIDLLKFASDSKKNSFAASIAVNDINDPTKKEEFQKSLSKFNHVSVREDRGKEIIEEVTGRKDIEVIVDPTMLLLENDWDKMSKKPKQLNSTKYILNYFLGELSQERKEEIERIAKENECDIINILDKKSPFYQTGPSEFLYLEKNAFLICTDSFHSSVFALLYNRPFVVFDREDSNIKMNSRIETLINKFNLKNRKFERKITEENLNHNYAEAYEILEKEREKANNFLKKALDLE